MTRDGGFGILDGGPLLFGYFQALDFGQWYDAPFSEQALENNHLYRRTDGLHLLIGATRLEYADGSIELIGDVSVPINHGRPELFKVQRPAD